MKKYTKPQMKNYDMAPVSILEGSVTIKGKIGISNFFTDTSDWEVKEDESTGTKTREYQFWE